MSDECDDAYAKQDVQIGVQVFGEQRVESVSKEFQAQRNQRGEMDRVLHCSGDTVRVVDSTSCGYEICKCIVDLFEE